MDYKLEHKIFLSEETEFMCLNSWSIQECDTDGKKIGRAKISWPWSLYFTASDLRYEYSIGICNYVCDDEEPIQEEEVITGILHSGICRDGANLAAEAQYSMLGTDRLISHFDLRIHKIGNDSIERCNLWGSVSHTSEVDCSYETYDDVVIANIYLLPERFEKIAELIKGRHTDILELILKGVYGFYSEWTPSISTDNIKILTDSEDQQVEGCEDLDIKPLRLGDVSEFDLRIIQRNKLNPRQDLRSINIEKLFEDSNDSEDAPDACRGTDKSQLMPGLLACNEMALKKLNVSIWFVFSVLCFIFFKI